MNRPPIPATRTLVHRISGIYFLFQGDTLIYVGRSQNVAKRIGQHADTKEFDSYTYIECSQDVAEDMEIEYIRAYAPPDNVTYCPSSPEHSKPAALPLGRALVQACEVTELDRRRMDSSPLSNAYWAERLGISKHRVSMLRKKMTRFDVGISARTGVA